MPGSLTAPGRQGTRDNAPRRAAFRVWKRVGTRNMSLSRLNGWPTHSPVNASPTPSRAPAHDSGPMRLATPSSQWTLTTYSLPVSRRTPNSLPNPRLSAYSLFDKDLEVLRDFLFETSQARRNPQRDFEDGIAALLFILGFSNINLGGIQRLQEAPDGLCCTPSGEYAIIECTTGHPDRDDKLSKLFTRAQALRATMDRAGLQQRKLLSVLVTALAKNEIPEAELTKAAEMRILVLCKDDLEAAVQRATSGESADRIYAQALADLNVSGQLPLPAA